jgi:hypothetical protein
MLEKDKNKQLSGISGHDTQTIYSHTLSSRHLLLFSGITSSKILTYAGNDDDKLLPQDLVLLQL